MGAFGLKRNWRAYQIPIWLFVCLLVGSIAGQSSQAQTTMLSLTTGALPPLIASPGHPGFIDQLARAAFARAGVAVDVTAVPNERSLINANAGLDDGDIFHSGGVAKGYPNLIRIPEPTMYSEAVAFSVRNDIRIRKWADLKPYSVAFTTGRKVFERNVVGVRQLTRTPTVQASFRLLVSGHVDVVLTDRLEGLWVVRQDGYKVHLIEPPLARPAMFMYLNKKHAALVPKVAAALVAIKTDGTYQALYDASLRPLKTP
jgi:polar amino acid transport system substrate-binding protein